MYSMYTGVYNIMCVCVFHRERFFVDSMRFDGVPFAPDERDRHPCVGCCWWSGRRGSRCGRGLLGRGPQFYRRFCSGGERALTTILLMERIGKIVGNLLAPELPAGVLVGPLEGAALLMTRLAVRRSSYIMLSGRHISVGVRHVGGSRVFRTTTASCLLSVLCVRTSHNLR